MPNGRDKLSVMNARIGSTADLDKQGYIYEPKLDGYRALCYVNGDMLFISRNEIDLTQKYPELTFRDAIQAKSCVLDGEIVAYDKQGKPNFQLLQQGHMVTYVVFDILMFNGKRLTDKPLLERKKILSEVVTRDPHLEIIFFTKDGHGLWNEAKKLGLEGVMAKEEMGRYYPGLRSGTWLKIKLLSTIDCVIIGFATTGRRLVSSLLLGLYDAQGNLHYVGKVGTGFSEKFLSEFYDYAMMIKTPYNPTKEVIREKVTWLKPLLACEVKFLEVTKDGALRAPVFLRMRFDKKPEDCTIEDQLKKT
jgi:bifunctional non-homologous end joining protein LigD